MTTISGLLQWCVNLGVATGSYSMSWGPFDILTDTVSFITKIPTIIITVTQTRPVHTVGVSTSELIGPALTSGWGRGASDSIYDELWSVICLWVPRHWAVIKTGVWRVRSHNVKGAVVDLDTWWKRASWSVIPPFNLQTTRNRSQINHQYVKVKDNVATVTDSLSTQPNIYCANYKILNCTIQILLPSI